MSIFITIALRLLLLYLGVRLAWSLFAGKKNTIPPRGKKAPRAPDRFDTQGKNVSDGDFKDLG